MLTDIIMITVEQTGNRLSSHDCTLHDLLTVLHLYMYILVIIRFNLHQRSKFA